MAAQKKGVLPLIPFAFRAASIDPLDAMAVGEAMEHVGWVELKGNKLVFPRFFVEKDSPEGRFRTPAAERQARYRERNKRNVTSDVTESVTRDVTLQTEKSREEKRINHNDDLLEVRKFLTEKGVDYHTKIGDGLGRMNGDRMETVKAMWKEVVNKKPQGLRPAAMARAIIDFEPKVTE
jgi:hypothetical protein